MRRVLPAIVLFIAASLRAGTCPTTAPTLRMAITPVCPAVGDCLFLAGNPVSLSIYPVPTGPPPCLPPPYSCEVPPYDGYKIQACDNVTWNFGDGSPDVTVTGQSTITHTYTTPGKYRPAVTVTNTLGSVTLESSIVLTIASNPPTWVGFSQWMHAVPENAGSVTFTLVRSGNVNTTAKVHCAHAEFASGPVKQGEAIGADITFNPGETTKTFTMKIYDDHLYGLPVSDCLTVDATDGTEFSTAPACYELIEVDPQPTGTIEDLRVPEGAKSGNVVVNFSAPFVEQVSMLATPSQGTATYRSDYFSDGALCNMPPGATQCTFPFYIADDDVPEADETFTFTIDVNRVMGPQPKFIRSTATITIVNDDDVITPSSMRIVPGTRATLKVNVGQTQATPLTIPLLSSSPEVLEVPASVTIPAGTSSAGFSARALQAGAARITANVPGMTTPPALISVVDAVSVIANPSALALRAGSDAVVTLSMQPPRADAQGVAVWSTSPEVATAPPSLTIPANGEAALTIHALQNGAATIWIVTAEGFSFPVDVTVSDGPPVSLSRVEPPNAPASGGSRVALIGEGLDARCSVSFGDAAATAITAANNGLSVVVPVHAAGVVDVTVVCGSARASLPNAFTFFVPRRRAAF